MLLLLARRGRYGRSVPVPTLPVKFSGAQARIKRNRVEVANSTVTASLSHAYEDFVEERSAEGLSVRVCEYDEYVQGLSIALAQLRHVASAERVCRRAKPFSLH